MQDNIFKNLVCTVKNIVLTCGSLQILEMEYGVLMEFPFGQPVVKHSVLESENSGKEHHPGRKYRMHERSS
jgi:hypothetical protein